MELQRERRYNKKSMKRKKVIPMQQTLPPAAADAERHRQERKAFLYLPLLALAVTVVVELFNHKSFTDGPAGFWRFMTEEPLAFLVNFLIVLLTLCPAFFLRRRAFWCALVSFLWLICGGVNGFILLNRMTPFTVADLTVFETGLDTVPNYLSTGYIILLIAALVLVAAGTPPEAPDSNALPNLDLAVQYLLSGAKDGVQIAYDGLHPAWATTEADCNDRFHHASVPFVPVQAPAFHRRRILQITPHPGIDYGVFDLTGVDAVLHRMYHSATVPEPATAFAHRCKEAGVPCLFVTPKPAAAYVTTAHLPGVWTSTTPESAFAKLLLTNGQDFDTMTLQVNENR